jgi:flagellar basal-body rod modification protein FlgD
MDVSAISGQSATVDAAQGTVETSKNNLGMDDFFKLLTTQLVSQDPLKPMQDTEFISQMASFSSLSQMELIAANTDASRQQQEAAAVMSLIGKQVEANGINGDTLSGLVTRVESIDGKLVPFIGDLQVPFLNITKITNAPTSADVEEPVA